MDFWYFAYGSNLLQEQMMERTGAIGQIAHPPKQARLENYRLVFQHLSEGYPAFANIQSPGDGVLGVVYRCSQADLEKLDHYECGYDRQTITVTDQQGEVLEAIAYIVKPVPTIHYGRSSEEYLAKIVTGAREHALPETYIDKIIQVANEYRALQ